MAGNTFSWIGGIGAGDAGTNWAWVSSTAGSIVAGPPATGDTAIITAGMVLMPSDATFSSNTIEIAGTGGTAAALQTNGDGSITLNHPTVDQATIIESLVQGQSAAGTTLLDSLGTFVNQGTIEANGTLGSTFTIDVQTGIAGNPGIFINESEIDVAAGNAMTIAVGPNAAFYNASLIQVAGGSLDIATVGTGQFDGGYAPLRGVVVISKGGTVENNTAYGTTVGGVAPYFAFADSANDVLKLDQPAQFGGRILGFAAGDTIDLGASLAVAGVSYDAATGILGLENGGGTTVASLAFVSGAFQTGSFAVSGTTAGSFGITTGSTDTVITTTATNEVWNSGTGGVFTAGSNWVGGLAPGASSAVVIGVGSGGSSGAITTAGSIAVQSLMFVGNSDSLVVSGSLGVGPGPLDQGGGTIEVTGGSTLGVTALSQIGGGALLLDSGALMTVSGHPNFLYENKGSITLAPGAGYGVFLQGTGLVNHATLLSAGLIYIGIDGSGTPAQMTVTSGLVSDTIAVVNSGPTSFGALTLTGTGTSWTDAGDATNSANPYGYMLLGYNDISAPMPFAGAASLSVSNGAILTDASYAQIAVGTNSAGVATVGAGGVWNIGSVTGGYLSVGASGSGTLDIAAGGTVAVGGVGTFVSNGVSYVTGGIGIGHYAGSAGTVTVGGLLTTDGGIGVGQAGNGTLDVTAGGTVALAAAGAGIGIGTQFGASGTVSVTGAGALVSLGTATTGIGVGQAGAGQLAVESGGTLYIGANGIGIGTSPSGSGTVTVSGGTIDVAGGGIAVGKFGPGTLAISDGGAVTIANYNLYLGGSPSGPSPGAVGLVTLQSGTTGSGGTLGVADNAYVWAGSVLSVNLGSSVDIGNSGAFVSGAVVVEAGHSLIGNGLVDSSVADSGTILALAGTLSTVATLEITGSVTGAGSVELAPNSELRLDAGLVGSEVVNFETSGAAILILDTVAATTTNQITGLDVGDRIDLGGIGSIRNVQVTSPGTVTISTNSSTYLLTGVSFASGASQSFYWYTDSATGYQAIQVTAPSLNWTGTLSTDLGTTGNWSPSGPPTSSETANFGLASGGTLTGSAVALNANFTGSGSWVLQAATVSLAGEPNPPYQPLGLYDSGTLTVNGGTLVDAGALDLSSSATSAAAMTVAGAAQVTIQQNIGIGFGAQSADLLVTGAGTDLQANGGFFFAGAGPGTVDVESGATFQVGGTGGFGVGAGAGSNDVLVVNGNGSVLDQGTAGNGMSVGGAGVGTVTVENGGSILLNETGGIGVGYSAAAVGIIGVSGSGALLSLGSTTTGMGLGSYGHAELEVLNGGTFAIDSANNGIGVGKFTGGSGTILVSGTGTAGNGALLSMGAASNGIGIGKAGTATLIVENSGTVSLAGGGIGIGQTAGGSGTLIVSGTGALLSLGTATNGIGVGQGSQGLFEILNGGTAAINSVGSGIGLGQTPGATGTLIVSGAGALLAMSTLGAGLNIGGNAFGPGGGAALVSVTGGGSIAGAPRLAVWAGSTLAVDSISGVDVGGSGTFVAGAVAIDSGYSLIGAGLVQAAVVDNGELAVSNTVTLGNSNGGTLEVTGAVSGTGILVMESGATLRLDGALGLGPTVDFTSGGAPETLILEQSGTSVSNPILNFGNLDRIELGNFSTINSATYANHTITVTGTVGGSAGSVLLTDVTLAAGAGTTNLLTGSDGGTGAQFVELACFAAGTWLAAPGGWRLVEALRAGDLVCTADGAARPVRWVGFRTIDLTRHPDPRRAQPIRILADAFADAVPSRDLVLSPDHAVFDRGRLVPIRLLVNDATILRETRRRKVTYYHVELDSHDLLLAEGLAAESYLDTGNRGLFENAPEPLVLHPDFTDSAAQQQRRLTESCAPLCAAPAEIEPLWFRLADRALALGIRLPEPEFTEEPSLAVAIGTRRLRPSGRDGERYRFALPAGVAAVLVSRAAYPQDARPWEEDQRRLGVMVRRLTLHRNGTAIDLPLDHPTLDRGWWAPETDGVSRWRWTDGAAALPVLDEAAELTVELAGTLAYPLPARGVVRNPDRRSAAAG